MTIRFTPTNGLLALSVFGLMATLALIHLATDRPWLGLDLAVAGGDDVVITAVTPGGPSASVMTPVALLAVSSREALIAVEATDLTPEPDALATYADMNRFFARQTETAQVLRQRQVVLLTRGRYGVEGRISVAPASHRPISDLPAGFWAPVAVGLTSFLVGMWVWTLRRRDTATGLFAVASFSILVFTFAAALYSSRELALGGPFFHLLSAVNHGGALLFGAAMVALLLAYPLPLVSRPWLAAPFGLAGIWWVGDTLQVFDGPALGIHLPVMIEMAGILACTVAQYWRARGDRKARIVLRWFGLSVVTGAGLFVLTVIAPSMVGFGPLVPQGYGFAFFLLIQVGLAIGVARYRLFDLDRWAFRILFYMTGAVLLLLIDAVLISWVALERAPALGLALVLVALIYLPLRDSLARWLTGRERSDGEIWFPDMMAVTLCRSEEERELRWRALLMKAFQALQVSRGPSLEAPTLVGEGVAMTIPAVGPLPPQQLEHRKQGRGLFSPRDVSRAGELRDMLVHAMQSQSAYDRGAAEERDRITRDMHDNIGIQLLGALHSRDATRKDDLIRQTLVDVREIINNSASATSTLSDMIADLRVEIADLVANAGLTLVWNSAAVSEIPPQSVAAVRSILREAVNNALKHAQATTIAVSMSEADGDMLMVVEDNGRGFAPDGITPGHGLENMRARALLLKGTVSVEPAAPGTRVTLRLAVGPPR